MTDEVVLPNGVRGWRVDRYDEARALLADPRISADAMRLRRAFDLNVVEEADRGTFDGGTGRHMNNTDPPEQTRLRGPVIKAFTVRRVAALRPRIERITAEVLSSMSEGECVDLVEAFACPLSVLVICEVLGVPPGDRDDFRDWSMALVDDFGANRGQEARQALYAYLSKLVAAKTSDPSDDLLGTLCAEPGGLSAQEIVWTALALLVGGHETTINLIANGVLSLLENAGQLAALQADRSLLPGAIEEVLRYESPVRIATFRCTAEPVELADITIPADQVVLIELGAANRDTERFPDGDRFDITRRPGGHLAFGHGAHRCPGAQLGRLEGEIAIGALLDRFPRLRLAVPACDLSRRDSMLIRGLTELPVVL